MAISGAQVEGDGEGEENQQMFSTGEKFTGATFLQFVKNLYQRFGRIMILCDQASQHMTKALGKYLEQNPDVKIVYFPTGSPYLNPVEACWKEGKRAVLASAH